MSETRYDIEIETISKPRSEYAATEYQKAGLPKAPAILIDDEIVVEGSDISEERLESIICMHLGLSEPLKAKTLIGRLFNQ